MTLDLFARNGATLSPCRQWRYQLWRSWDDAKPTCAFIGLNPSTADETKDDPTIRRCIAFSKLWGFGRFEMLNLFAWRSTDPRGLLDTADPVGPLNDAVIRGRTGVVARTVLAWGSHRKSAALTRLVSVRGLELTLRLGDLGVRGLGHLGRNDDRQPKHPLYLAASTPFIPISGASS